MEQQENKKPFTILFCKGWNPSKGKSDRGGFTLLLDAYQIAFKKTDNVRLLAKLNASYINHGTSMMHALKNVGVNPETCPIIEIIENNIPYEQLVDIYHRGDIHVIPTKGEAFCLTALEGLSCGLPTATTDAGGQVDFVNETNGWILPTHPVPAEDGLLFEECTYKECDVYELAKLLRYLYEHPEEVEKKRKVTAESIKEFTWDNSAKKAMEALEKLKKE